MKSICFVEDLTLFNWFFQMIPFILRRRPYSIYVLDGSATALVLAKATARLLGQRVERFSFRLVDVKDEAGLLIALRIAHQDYSGVGTTIMRHLRKRVLQNGNKSESRLFHYLSKNLAMQSIYGRHTLSHVLLLVQLVAWKMRGLENRSQEFILFLGQRPWLGPVREYALRYAVKIELLFPRFRLNLKQPWVRSLYRMITNQIWHLRYRPFQKKKRKVPVNPMHQHDPKVIVDCHYHLNLSRPEIFSELFFLQQSKMSGKDFVVTFHVPKEPLNAQKMAELKQFHILPVALRPEATTVPESPPFYSNPRLRTNKKDYHVRNGFSTKLEDRFVKKQLVNYQREKTYWTDLFHQLDSKIYVSWYKYGPEHCAIADAMEERGGISTLYQRALETNPTAMTAVHVDLFFGFSKQAAEVERHSHSIIPYFVVTGYLGDHRFSLLQETAQKIRKQLLCCGAKHIVSFTDENSQDEERWSLGHTITRENYAFLLEKVLTTPWFGLVLKPKIPATLRCRLGPVADLLTKALATGRCYLYEEGGCHGSYPPSVASLAADIAIHGHLCAPTAGFEAALGGTPTLLMDREGWKASPLYQLGVGKVVFNDWETLWSSCCGYWKRNGSLSGFGDWAPLLNQMDPFQDGRAAERMGTYLQWLLEGLKAGKGRDTVLADTADRYCKQWGDDKVLSVS